MALTVPVAVAILFFIFFFALYARKFFSGFHDHGGRQAPPPPPSNWRRVSYYYYPPVSNLGLDPSVVRALPVLAYGSSVGGVKPKEGCVVCLVDFEEMEKVKLIPGCGHVFHPGCIDGWLLLHGSCPVCRCSEWVCVDLSGRAHEEEEEVMNIGEVERGREGGEEERKVVALALGRSRSLSFCSNSGHGGGGEEEEDKDEDERRVGLRRTRSVV